MEKRFNMRKTPLLSLLAIFVLLVAGATALPARAQTGPNLLENPGFENGHYSQDGIPQITVPNGWRMYWSNDELIFGGEWVTTRPETVVWNIKGSPPGEEFYWKDGAYTMKVFNTWAPMWAALAQDVEGLQVGTKYRLSVPIYIDVFADYEGGQKIKPERKDMAKIRLGAGPVGATWRDEAAISYSGWWTGDSIPEFYQAYPLFVYDFTATQPNMTVYIEMASAYPFPNNGFFFDTPSLVSLGAAPAAAAPAANPAAGQPAASQPAAPAQAQPAATIVPPTPRPDGSIVHTVVAGDTLWVIAIQYAEVLGLAPLDALAAIRELNNDPTFINPGDEILIKAGTGEAPTAAADAAAGTPAATGEAGTPPADATVAGDATPDAAIGGDATAEPGTATDATGAGDTGSEAATPAAVAGTICVGAFLDANADGQRNEGEELVANAAVAISRGGTTVSTYITDGVSEPYCFELTEADSYQLQLYPPAGLAATTEDNWAVSIANGESYTVLFGLGNAPAADAAAADAATQPTAGDQAAATDTANGTVDDATANADGGLFSGQLGIIVLGVGGFLLVLAALGVYLLRRG